jgi:hypothetical protein
MAEGIQRVGPVHRDPEALARVLVLTATSTIRVDVPQHRHVDAVPASMIQLTLHVASSRFVAYL